MRGGAGLERELRARRPQPREELVHTLAARVQSAPRLHQHVEQQSVIRGGAVRLIRARIQIPQSLRGFLVLRRLVEHGFIRRNRILDAVFLQEAFRFIQIFADVCGHQAAMPLRNLSRSV